MAGKVFFSVSMSLDGYVAPVHPAAEPLFAPENRDDPQVQRWLSQWGELQSWVFPQRFFRENTGFGEGGEEGRDNDLLRQTFERTGASVLGKRMFDLGEQSWPEDAPFHTPVFVLTHTARADWARPGGTTFHFATEGISAAVARAREAAGDRDVRIGGGAETILQALNAGLVDEFSVTVSPVLFGAGARLFEGIDADRIALEPLRSESVSRVTHLSYAVKRR
ncbi:deaminase [Kitasatospora sp. MMS16-BH015]|uniref:dihydrofolate reductase family protein n=1 Tax=Kitasatospora sp. MMS16-BH015 TaxID=2018025 RepID=UPI000CA125CA|nr:dihydrofolate reductase family protein [Kitasatospora sp. MMS16-BH015]AUG81026.1 deaminase [Kitasatospora sp. MMS16-BH015]